MSLRLQSAAIVAALLLMPLVKGTAPVRGDVHASAQSASPEWTALTTRLETAALADDAEGVKAARVECLRLLAASPSPERATILRYTVAYAAWRLAFTPKLAAAEQVALLTDAETQLKAVVAAQPAHAEALGLLAAVYGARIGKNPDLGMTLGPASGEVLGRAMAADPLNPRLLVIRGSSLFHTPPEFGGSVKDAEASFRQALQRFEVEPADKPWPNWGRFDAYAWLGQALEARKDKPGARAAYEKALAIAPKNGWVRYTLLPAVK